MYQQEKEKSSHASSVGFYHKRSMFSSDEELVKRKVTEPSVRFLAANNINSVTKLYHFMAQVKKQQVWHQVYAESIKLLRDTICVSKVSKHLKSNIGKY